MLLTTTSVAHALAAAVAAPAPAVDISSELLQLAQQYQAYQKSAPLHSAAAGLAGASKAAAKFTPKNLDVHLVGQTVVVDAVASGTTAKLKADLVRLGAKIIGTTGRMVSAYVPLTAINSLKSLASLREADAVTVTVKAGSVMTQGDAAMYTNEVRQDLSLNGTALDGAGVKIGVISDSFDSDNGTSTTATQDVESGDLPGPGNPEGYDTPVTVLFDESGTDEGRAMLQIIHDVAPGATLYFCACGPSDTTMASAIQQLQQAGCNIVCDDVGYSDELFFQDGIISQAVTAAVNAGVHYFSAAGNDGDASYQSNFNAGAKVTAMSGNGQDGIGTVNIAAGTLQNFNPGGAADDYQKLTVPVDDGTPILLQWDQPAYSASTNAGGTASCLNEVDEYLLSKPVLSPANVVAYSNYSTVGGDPIQELDFSNDGSFGAQTTFYLAIESVSGIGPAPGLLQYILDNDGDATITIGDYATNSGTSYGHPMAVGAAGVGAAWYQETPAYGVSPPRLAPGDPWDAASYFFSSEGGIPTLFSASGIRYGQEIVQQAPLIVGPDGVSTSMQATATGYGFDPFFGTSAATPHVAALDALMIEAADLSGQTLTSTAAYTDLENTAIAMGTPQNWNTPVQPGPSTSNYYAGYGLVDGPAAVATVGGPYTVTLAGTSGNDQMSLSQDGNGNLVFTLNGTQQFVFPLKDISNIVVEGDGGSDTLTVNYSNGNPIPASGLTFDASADTGATLDVSGGQFASINDTLTGPTAGSIALTLTGAPSSATIQCMGVTSVDLAVTSVNDLTFSLPTTGSNSSAVLGDDSGHKAGVSEIHGMTFQDTLFANPTNSLTVNLGPDGDVLTLQPMDAAFNPAGGNGVAAPLMINGGTGGSTLDISDTSTVARTLNFAYPTPLSGGLSVTGFGGVTIALTQMGQVDYASGANDNAQATVVGSNNPDQFTVTPSGLNSATVELDGGSPGPNLTFSGLAPSGGLTLDGAGPSTAPGDTLFYSTTGTAVVTPSLTTPGSGTITQSGMIEVAYLNFETGPIVGSPPTADANGPYTISEGQSLALDASGSIANNAGATLVYTWYLDGSLLVDAGSSAQTTVPWSTILALGPADASPLTTHTIGLQVTDSIGMVSTATASLTIQHVAPTVSISGSATAYATVPYPLALSAQEIGVETITGWQINWGDNTPMDNITGDPSSATHTYATANQACTITATAFDQSSGYPSNSVSVNVGTAIIGLAPITLAPANVVPFQTVSASSIYYNPGTSGTLNGTWNWGDTNKLFPATIVQAPGAVSGINGSYTYTNPGTYTITLAVQANGGPPVTATQQVVVTAAALEPDPANPGGTILAVGGTTGNDIILFGQIGPAGTVAVALNNRILGSFSTNGIDEIMVFGGGGTDYVNASGTGLNVMYVGGSGNDTMKGGAGRTVMIGGTGSSKLTAGSGSTLMIAGSTAFDNNTRALAAIMAEWDSSDSYAQRVAYLTGTPGGHNGTYYLQPGATVHGSNSASTLTGGSGRDLFFADYPASSSSKSVKKDTLLGLTQGEIIADLSVSLE